MADMKWIPVSERLPEKKGRYLVCTEVRTKWRTYMQTVWYATSYDGWEKHLKGKNLRYAYDSEFGDYEISGVTHWMPLPEPPEEVE